MECLGLHNKPKAEVHLGHMLTGPKEEEEEEEEEIKFEIPFTSIITTVIFRNYSNLLVYKQPVFWF
jgi:hypothetical protein